MRRVMYIALEYLLWRLYPGETLLIMVDHKERLVLEPLFYFLLAYQVFYCSS